MAKRGQMIDELYISLGLDIAKLQLDFDTAGKTVSQAVARLSGKENNIKLKLDIDLAKLEGAGTALDKIKAKHEAISQLLDVQRKKEEILVAVLQDAQKSSGMDSEAARRAETNLLKQQRVVAQTESQMRKLNAELKKMGVETDKAGGKFAAFGAKASAAFNKAKSGLNSLNSGFTLLSTKTAALMAVFATGAGLFTLTRGAMEAGEKTYRLAKRLNATAAEAGLLNRTFQLAGADVMTVIPLIARLDKQVTTAGLAGNDATKAMQHFGISLTDQYGKLLPLNQQIERLADGFENAVKMGQEEEYVAEVLGARGAALLPILEQYKDLAQIAASVKTTGLLNPEEAHKTWLQWKLMEMELSQLKSALGAALLPLTSELMPTVSEMFRGMVAEIGNNKDVIKGAILGIADALKIVAETLVFVGDQFHKIMERSKARSWLWEKHPLAAPLAYIPGIAQMTVDPLYGDEYKAHLEKQREEEKKAQAEKAAAAEAERERQSRYDSTRIARLKEEAAKAETELTRKIADITGSELENALRSVEKEIDALKAKGYDVKLLDEYKLAKEAKIYEDFERNVMDSINSIHRTALENRLAEIEKEKQAWIKKGVDEVKATEWAEQSKLDAKRNAALQVLQSQKEEFYAFLEGGERGLGNYYIQKHGLTPFDLETTPEEIEAFERAKKAVLENVLPNFRDPAVIAEEERRYRDNFRVGINGQYFNYDEYQDALASGFLRQMGKLGEAPVSQGEAAAPTYADNRQVNIQVSIENAVTQDNEGMRQLADTVADRIRPAVENALGGESNSYSNW